METAPLSTQLRPSLLAVRPNCEQTNRSVALKSPVDVSPQKKNVARATFDTWSKAMKISFQRKCLEPFSSFLSPTEGKKTLQWATEVKTQCDM